MATVSAMFTITDTGDLSGRNLLQRSFFTKEPWTGPQNAVDDGFGMYHDKYCLPVTVGKLYTNTNRGVDNIFPDLVFEEGVQYTISGKWAQFRTDTKYNLFRLYICHTDGTEVFVRQPEQQNNTWLSFKLTSTAGKTVSKITTTYGYGGITYIADFKLEVGAAATDWTSAPEDVNTALIDAKEAQSTADNAQTAASNAQTDATYAKNEIDGLEIGGRNILKHSEQAGIINRYGQSVINTESNIVVDEWATKTGIRYYGNSGTSSIFGIIGGGASGGNIAQKTAYYLNRPYTFSAYVKNLSESSRLRFRVNGTALANAVEIAPLEQKRVTYVYSNPNTAAAVQFTLYVDAAGDAFDFVMWHPQIEYGTRVTDWTPAPEDIEEAINSKNSVYYQTTAPTGNLKDGDTWFDTANDYKIRRWNGSTWAAAELGNQAIGNLNASHINAGTLTAVDIEAGKAQDIAGTINVYDEDDAVKVSLDKDGLVATKGKIGNWDISSYSIEYQEDIPSSEDTVIGGDEDEQLIDSGTPTLVGGATLKLKICTYDPNNPNLGPHIISSVVENGVAPQNDNGKTMRISSGGLACYYNRNNGVTGGSVSINPKLINVINADYDENQILWTDSANLNPGSLTIIMSKTENGEQTSIGRSFLTYRDLSFLGDSANPQLASGIAHWSVLAARRAIKDELGVTIYHCGNLFWAHFDGKMTVGWASRMEEYISIVPNDDASFTNSKLCAPPNVLEKYCLPQSPANPRAIYRVFPDGQLGLYHFIPPTNGTNNYEVLTYDNWEPCDIFWAHIG